MNRRSITIGIAWRGSIPKLDWTSATVGWMLLQKVSMVLAYLHRIDRDAKMARFYSIDIAPTLFGEVSVLRTQGRIGTHGHTSMETCATRSGRVGRRPYTASEDPARLCRAINVLI